MKFAKFLNKKMKNMEKDLEKYTKPKKKMIKKKEKGMWNRKMANMKSSMGLTEAREKTPEDWVDEYMSMMKVKNYKSWEQFFDDAVMGTFYWSEDIYLDKEMYGYHDRDDKWIDKFRGSIKKVKSTSSKFAKYKKHFGG